MKRIILTTALAAALGGCAVLDAIAPGVTPATVRASAPRSLDESIQLAKLELADAYALAASMVRASLLSPADARELRADLDDADAALSLAEFTLGGGGERQAKLTLDSATAILRLVQQILAAKGESK